MLVKDFYINKKVELISIQFDNPFSKRYSLNFSDFLSCLYKRTQGDNSCGMLKAVVAVGWTGHLSDDGRNACMGVYGSSVSIILRREYFVAAAALTVVLVRRARRVHLARRAAVRVVVGGVGRRADQAGGDTAGQNRRFRPGFPFRRLASFQSLLTSLLSLSSIALLHGTLVHVGHVGRARLLPGRRGTAGERLLRRHG